ncbi:MAG: hypothetical protein ACREQ5_32585 [Candidatus Dormibacteria bacterium]
MARPRAARPAGSRGEHLQRATSVPASWLSDGGDDPTSRQLEEYEQRLAADADLVTRLQFSGFAGEEWDALADVLAGYGIAVARAWLGTGLIFERCRAKRLRGAETLFPVPMTESERRDLVDITVGVAVAAFREQILIPHIWDPRRGATLKTFFVGRILIHFVDEYRSFVTARNRSARLACVELNDGISTGTEHPETIAMDRLEMERLLARVQDACTRAMVELRLRGFTKREIAEIVGLSERAVEETGRKQGRQGPFAAVSAPGLVSAGGQGRGRRWQRRRRRRWVWRRSPGW